MQSGYADESLEETCTKMSSGSRGLSASLMLMLSIFGLHAATAGAEGRAPASSGHMRFRHYFLVVALAACAMLLQGCNLNVPTHEVGNWRTKDNYLTVAINSCANPDITEADKCSGNGYCRSFDLSGTGAAKFCQCDDAYAGSECTEKRKSQITTFILSLLFGYLGVDYFYLGHVWWGILKLVTLGFGGLWWFYDVVRVGAGPVPARNYKTSHDLPHWVYVLSTIVIFMMLGFSVSLLSYIRDKKKRQAEVSKLSQIAEVQAALDYGSAVTA